jgi:cysteine-rich repeat protein
MTAPGRSPGRLPDAHPWVPPHGPPAVERPRPGLAYPGPVSIRAGWMLASSLLVSTACVEPDTRFCGDGFLCPAGTLCFEARCVLPEQLSACVGRDSGEPCSYRGTPSGVCDGAVCIPSGCGNGVLEATEICDDGNNASGDGCSANCDSTEECGNGITDTAVGEGCDCGTDAQALPVGCNRPNSNDPGAVCRMDCQLHGCGDGVLRPPEECDGDDLGGVTCEDLGFYGGTLGCWDFCRFDTDDCIGYCGDGILNGPEFCDQASPPGETCVDYGFDLGSLGCTAVCTPTFTTCGGIGWRPIANADFSGRALTRTASGQMFAVGSGGTILHYDGETWEIMASGTGQFLDDVWAYDDELAFTVGVAGTLLHYDGSTWAAMVSGTTAWLTGVWGTSPTDVYVTGEEGLLLHYDGSGWSAVDVGTTVRLSEIWGTGPEDIFIAGYDGVILHYDGNAWSPMATGSDADLNFIWGTGPSDVYASGFAGALLHYDGTDWSTIPTGTEGALWAVGGIPGDTFVVGQAVRHSDGVGWSHLRESPHDFVEIMGTEAGIFAVGSSGNIMQFEGLEWAPGTHDADWLLAAWGTSQNDVVVVGEWGTIARYDGRRWIDVDSPTEQWL